MNASVCVCVCVRDKRRTNVFSKDDRCKQKRLKHTNVSLERENRERDSHATEALLRTLDDRGRSKGHRYRPACDALRTVAGDVEGGQEQRAKETSRREKRGGGKGAETRSTEKRCVRRPPDRRHHFLASQIQNVTRTRGRAPRINRPSTTRGWGL